MKKLNHFMLLTTASLLFLAMPAKSQWTEMNSPVSDALYDIDMTTGNTGYAAGYYGTFLKSVDGGNNWTALSVPFTDDLQSVFFFNADSGFVAGNEGLFRTSDGGQNWTQVVLPDTQSLHHVEFLDAFTGFATGSSTSIYKTTDGGLSWQKKNVDTVWWNAIADISFPSVNIGYAVMKGYNTHFFKTTDGGENWFLNDVLPFCPLTNIEGIHFTSDIRGFFGGWYIGAFYETNDGGTTWTDPVINGSTTTGNYYDVDFMNSTTGVMVGYGGDVLITADGGTTWNPELANAGSLPLYAVCFDDNGTVFSAGDGGKIYRRGAISSVTESTIAPGFSAYPNPFETDFIIHFPQMQNEINIVIYNAVGDKIYDQLFFHSSEIKPEIQMNSGVYFVKIKTENFEQAGKIIKQ
ncbi:MAG: YCF48-related protein [Bacteroidota bacterium]